MINILLGENNLFDRVEEQKQEIKYKIKNSKKIFSHLSPREVIKKVRKFWTCPYLIGPPPPHKEKKLGNFCTFLDPLHPP